LILATNQTLGFEVGGLYSRRLEVHARFGGQQQGGISTPRDHPYIFAFTGEVGRAHGYHDYWDEDGLFHYFGEGQSGDMTYTGGNRAILRHAVDGKRLFVFQMLGRGKPYRFLGEFNLVRAEEVFGSSNTSGETRKSIVFVLEPILAEVAIPNWVSDAFPNVVGPTSKSAIVQVRTQQSLFRKRVADFEKGCRLTNICDLRFLRASHVKPWSKCDSDAERIDGNNGLLLCPQGDLLFDRGWITFDEKGGLVRAAELPADVVSKIGLNLRPGRRCGEFRPEQQNYMDFHRSEIFGKKFTQLKDPLGEILAAID
jgi:5-methylcytosine-specific restriction enzyme A